MSNYLFYAMRGEMMCFRHVLLNALDLHQKGHTVRIIFEGESVKLPPILAGEQDALYEKCLTRGLIAGVCHACSHTLGVLAEIKKLKLPLLADMEGHAGMAPFVEQGYQVTVF